MAVNLTEGGIEILANQDAQATDVKPVLQVADIRLVNTQQPSTKERYRLLLSDGNHLMQGMLTTEKNELVKAGKLQKGSVVQLTQFVCNVIQSRRIVIIIDLDLILEKCETIGEPKQYGPGGTSGGPVAASRSSAPLQPSMDQSGPSGNPQSLNGHPQFNKMNVGGGVPIQHSTMDHIGASPVYGGSFAGNSDSGRYVATHASTLHPKMESGAGIPRSYGDQNIGFRNPKPEASQGVGTYARMPRPTYQQPPPMYTNRGPVAKNEAPPRIIPIAALNPYQGRWTIKARVTAKGELRHYNNPRGDGKVFSFDLLDSDGGEIRVTCFNVVADQFYNQIEAGKVYLISKGSLKPAQKNFNHLSNEYEIHLEATSTVQPCYEDDSLIPRQQFHFRPISDVEGMANNNVVDVIGVVSSISPSATIMRKNGTETQKRSLQLKDMSGRSVELTLWGSFCDAEGQRMQNMCDSGVFPVLAVKSGRVNDFNGKAVGTISTSQLFIEPDFPEAHKLREWFNSEGCNTPTVSISREFVSTGRTDARKTLSQIKDEKLGTSEKPDWITVSATITFVKTENFCYTACPIMIGDRQCNKKVTNNGDGKWRCDRCDQSVDECDYRYILQFQITDHTSCTWVTAFQESGEEIMGISAKDLYHLKCEEQDDEIAEIMNRVRFSQYIFKLKVKEEVFSDEQRVKSTVVKAEKINFISEPRFLLDLMDKLKGEDSGSLAAKEGIAIPASGISNAGFGNVGIRQSGSPTVNYIGNSSSVRREMVIPANQVGQHGNQYCSSRLPASSSAGVYVSCNSCGGTGHSSSNCPSVMNGLGHSTAGDYGSRMSSGAGGGAGGASGECFKCHQFGHWARDCPGLMNAPPVYGSSGANTGRYGGVSKQQVGGF
ncbi:replication protein A 70 kDa DNA-binding subunit A-like [Malania oleifera]|uniref:replication protein A 70 kDa DNA-binding subunit A-like n=1 Tax=Malania oleifera TaxID=397392 RepID=UPI0025AE502F|nr:replication protein A 70 kDa DNA-binding subunit A-like [Malania oleifera]